MKETAVDLGAFDRVSPTAWGIAYRRAACDLPCAREVFDALNSTLSNTEREHMLALVSEKDQALTPYFEARYRLLNQLLAKEAPHQILELASGLSPRGLDLSKDPSITYVEMDLPGVIEQKSRITEMLTHARDLPHRSNLHLISLNVLEPWPLARMPFRDGTSVAVIHEGLFRYLTHEQKGKVIEHIRSLIDRFGGVYITPDIPLRVEMDPRLHHNMTTTLGVDMNANVFASISEAEHFFSSFGFSVEQHPFEEVRNGLVSPRKLHLSEEQVQREIDRCVCFVMCPV